MCGCVLCFCLVVLNDVLVIMMLFVVGLIDVIDWFGLFGLGVVWAVLLVWCLSGLVVFVDLVLFVGGVC